MSICHMKLGFKLVLAYVITYLTRGRTGCGADAAAAALASELLCTSARAGTSSPAIQNLRASKRWWFTQTHGCSVKSAHFFHFPRLEKKKVGRWMLEAIAGMGLVLPRYASRNNPHSSDSMNGEKIGSSGRSTLQQVWTGEWKHSISRGSFHFARDVSSCI